jgi:queuosine precursor transporter
MTGPTRAGPAGTGPAETAQTDAAQTDAAQTDAAQTDAAQGRPPVGEPALLPPRRALSLAPRSGWPHGSRLALAVVGFAVYVASIAGANWMISHVGRPVAGAHVLPVGFGLEAPSGVYLAGLTFVARDIVQRLIGLRVGVVAIVIGATLSWWFSSPAIAVASGVTFLLSESCDFLVYTPLQARHFPFAVVGSGLVADVVDSVVFLTLAGIPLAVALPGQLVGKAWVVLIGGVVAGFLRRYGPFKNPA